MNTYTDKGLTALAKKLARKFRDDCQILLDDEDMHEALYDSAAMQALVMAQTAAMRVLVTADGFAEDVGNEL